MPVAPHRRLATASFLASLALSLCAAGCKRSSPSAASAEEQDDAAAATALEGARVVHFTGRTPGSRESLPPPLHAHGEAIRGAWMAPDGTSFLAGYNYTGLPGAETGVIYRQPPGGAWTIVHSKRSNELGTIWGTSANDVWVCGIGALLHFDGTAWREEPVPVREGYLNAIWGNGKELFVVGSDVNAKSGDTGRIYRRDETGTWMVESHAPSDLLAIAGSGSLIMAVGRSGLVLRRMQPGTWAPEPAGHGTHTRLAIVNEHDLWIAGTTLLHSKGDGTWSEEKLADDYQTVAVWARGPGDVYAGTLRNLYRLRGTTWRPTPWKQGVGTLAGNATSLLVTQ